VGEQERLPAAGGAQCVVSGGEKGAANPAPGMSRMNEEKELLSVPRMNGRICDNPVDCVDRDQEHIRRRMVGDELIPFPRRKHRLGRDIAKIGPAQADCCAEDHPDACGIRWNGRAKCDWRRRRRGLVHEIPPSALGSRA